MTASAMTDLLWIHSRTADAHCGLRPARCTAALDRVLPRLSRAPIRPGRRRATVDRRSGARRRGALGARASDSRGVRV